ASVHQPSIRARAAAHDVSIRSSTIDTANRRGWAPHSMSRSWQTIDHPENARTGTSAVGSGPALARRLHDERDRWGVTRDTPKAAELVIVNLIAEHDVEADEELAGESHLGLGPPASMEDGEVAAPKIVIAARGEGRRLPQDPAEEGIALLGDLAEV